MKQIYNEAEFRIVRRPLIYYEVSVINTPGMRKRNVIPVSIECDEFGMPEPRKLDNGETIIGCIPAVHGSFMVYAEFSGQDEAYHETLLGIEVPGATHERWDDEAQYAIESVYGGRSK